MAWPQLGLRARSKMREAELEDWKEMNSLLVGNGNHGKAWAPDH